MPTITLFVGLYLATESPTDAQLQASMGSHVPNMLASNLRSALPHVDELGALGASFANYGALQKGWELRADELDRYAHSLSDEYASVTDSAALHAKILSGSVQSLGARIEELEALGANRCVFFPDRTDPGWFDTACRVVPALSRIAAPRAP
jgi:alkanesulfonate monooxygenase SsuD/methylene tetrahydromethanopterin reductase-like flavin-dependent oxidoreductase (luciferase family)